MVCEDSVLPLSVVGNPLIQWACIQGMNQQQTQGFARFVIIQPLLKLNGRVQVVALNVRSKAKASQPLPSSEDELDYCQSLNKGLPEDIRVLGWTDLSPDFSARHAYAAMCTPSTCCDARA